MFLVLEGNVLPAKAVQNAFMVGLLKLALMCKIIINFFFEIKIIIYLCF